MLAVLLIIPCVAAAPEFPELRTPPSTMPADAPKPKAIAPADVKAWEARRKEIRTAWEQILGPMPARVPLNVEVVSREELDDHSRLLLRYQNDAKSTNDAFLLIPKDAPAGRKLPGVVVLHPTNTAHYNVSAGLAGKEGSYHALHLVRRGYVCIAPRNYLWAVEGRGWKQSAADVKKQGRYTTGWRRCCSTRSVRWTCSSIGPRWTRIASARSATALAARRRCICRRSTSGSSRRSAARAASGWAMSNWADDHYFGKVIAGPDFAHDNQEVLALIAPRAILVIGGEASDGAKSWPYIEAALPVWRYTTLSRASDCCATRSATSFPRPAPTANSPTLVRSLAEAAVKWSYRERMSCASSMPNSRRFASMSWRNREPSP
jgi:hypothetical protein